MADEIPAGWYPDIHGTVRWWDGDRWTDHVRDSPSSATSPPEPIAEVPASQPPRAPEPTGTEISSTTGTSTHAANLAEGDVDDPVRSGQSQIRSPLERYASETASSSFTTPPAGAESWSGTTVIHRPTRTISYPMTVEEDIEEDDGDTRRLWLTATVVGLVAFFLGLGIGGRSQVDPPETSEPIPPAATAGSDEIDQLRQQLEERQAELDERQKVLDDREDDLERQASATPSPTPTARATETEIDGNDRVLVGTDVREGTYRTNGPSDPLYECEYTVSEDQFGDDPITDESTTSSASVSLRDGDWFESDDCQDWERD